LRRVVAVGVLSSEVAGRWWDWSETARWSAVRWKWSHRGRTWRIN